MDKDKIIQVIKDYSNYNFEFDNINRPTDTDIELIIKLLESLPDNLPTPKPMISDKGNIGLYWDNKMTYIDIELEKNKLFTIFIRSRKTRQEYYNGFSLSDLVVFLIGFFEND